MPIQIKDKQGEHYVYTLAYPESMGGAVFYVGKGSGDRINAHEWLARGKPRQGENTYKNGVIRKIWSEGGTVVKKKIAVFGTHEEALQYEIALIFLMDGLTNLTSGGDGIVGLVRTDEHNRKIGMSNRGRKQSEAARRQMSEAAKKRFADDEARRAISETIKQHWDEDKEYRHKMLEHQRKNAEAKRGHARPPFSEQWRRNMSEGQKGRIHSEETRRRMSESQKGRTHSEQTRRRIGEASKGRNVGRKYTDDELRKMSGSRKQGVSQKDSEEQL